VLLGLTFQQWTGKHLLGVFTQRSYEPTAHWSSKAALGPTLNFNRQFSLVRLLQEHFLLPAPHQIPVSQ
jgi:hypothetical protein